MPEERERRLVQVEAVSLRSPDHLLRGREWKFGPSTVLGAGLYAIVPVAVAHPSAKVGGATDEEDLPTATQSIYEATAGFGLEAVACAHEP
jgi:hypothetical protein